MKALARSLLLCGSLLLCVNLIGLFCYTTVDETEGRQVSDKARISAKSFWTESVRHQDEDDEAYARRLTELVYNRMVHADADQTRPTFFENFILWAKAQRQDYWHWMNTRRAVRLGGGLCAQQAFVLNDVLRRERISSRIIHLNGHVLNEAYLNGHWRVLDPDFNIVFDHALRELEDNPQLVIEPYLAAHVSPENAQMYSEFFASSDDNWHFKTFPGYGARDYFFEQLALILVWLIPLGLMMSGMGLRLYWTQVRKTLRKSPSP